MADIDLKDYLDDDETVILRNKTMQLKWEGESYAQMRVQGKSNIIKMFAINPPILTIIMFRNVNIIKIILFYYSIVTIGLSKFTLKHFPIAKSSGIWRQTAHLELNGVVHMREGTISNTCNCRRLVGAYCIDIWGCPFKLLCQLIRQPIWAIMNIYGYLILWNFSSPQIY